LYTPTRLPAREEQAGGAALHQAHARRHFYRQLRSLPNLAIA